MKNRIQQWKLRLNNRLVAWGGVIGVRLLPCPDCGLPLGIKLWPAAALVWLFQRARRRQIQQLDLLLRRDLSHPPSSGGTGSSSNT